MNEFSAAVEQSKCCFPEVNLLTPYSGVQNSSAPGSDTGALG